MTIQKCFKAHLESIIEPNSVNEAKHCIELLRFAMCDASPTEAVRFARYYGFEYMKSEIDIYKALAYLSQIVVKG